MKIILESREEVLSFISTKDLIEILKCRTYSERVLRVELTSKEFGEMLHDVDFYDPVAIDSEAPDDYSGCYVRLDNRWCAQTHNSYFE